jgi:hypothetical protein
MKLVFVGLLFLPLLLSAQEIVIQPGASATCEKVKQVVRCENLSTCELKFHFVSKKWQVILPDGKIFGEYKSRDEGLKNLKDLAAMNTCEKTKIGSK